MPEPEDIPEDQATIRDFLAAVDDADQARAEYASQAPDAMRRLAQAAYGHDNRQAQIVATCLASIYNDAEARPVRLDEIRRLDWSLQKDLLAVMIGTGHGGFADTDIAKAFEEVGGPAAVDWFHWYTAGGPHRAALGRLVAFITKNRTDARARALHDLLASLASSRNKASLAQLDVIEEEYTQDFVLILDGLFGREQGLLALEDISAALRAAKLLP
jgi:hypothetical protein